MGKTPLYPMHIASGAKMCPFGGYEMPLWYPDGVRKEHLSVLTTAGMFDTSHMSVLILEGEGTKDLLDVSFCRDIRSLSIGRCAYGVFLNAKGHVIDDAIVYALPENRMMVVLNAGMGAVITTHLRSYPESLNTIILDMTDKLGKIDLQGPKSPLILGKLVEHPEEVFQAFPYFSFKGFWENRSGNDELIRLNDGTHVLISRTGYTGELGFELFMHPDRLESVWTSILSVGAKHGLITCGLAARDSLRAGAMLPLSQKDIGAFLFRQNPWEFVLPFNEKRTGFNRSFTGSDALLQTPVTHWTFAFAGYDPRKITEGQDTVVLDLAGNRIGEVLSCVTDMGIGRVDGTIVSVASPDVPYPFSPGGLACGFVRVSTPLEPGNQVVLSDKRRKVTVEIVDDIRPHRSANKPLNSV